MTLIRFSPILLAGFLSPAYADQYQDAINKTFPGYRILSPSEIRLDKKEMEREIYNRVKNSPGRIVGKINSDNIVDFAALIRSSTRKILPEDPPSKRPAMAYYDGYLAVCYGLGAGQYKCEKLDEKPLRMFMPTDYFLEKVSPGKQFCTFTQKFRPPRNVNPNLGFDPDAEPSTGEVSIRLTTDAIGLRGDREANDYVYLPGGMYLECGLTG